jgi:hypothetical protein
MGQNIQLGVKRRIEHLENREKKIGEVEDKEHLKRPHIIRPSTIDVFAREKSWLSNREDEGLYKFVIYNRGCDQNLA